MEKTRTQDQANKETFKEGKIARGMGTNQVLGTPTLQEAYQIRRGEEHLK